MHFYIDPGHRNSVFDFGSSAFGAKESEIALQISTKLGDRLKQMGHQVSFSRMTEQEVISLQDRVKKANGLVDVDYYVSIHINSYTQETSNGFEVFHYGSLDALSENICNKVCKKTAQINRGSKTEKGFYVLRATRAKAILIECGFISNKKELAYLTSETGQKEIANGIIEGFGFSISNIPVASNNQSKTPSFKDMNGNIIKDINLLNGNFVLISESDFIKFKAIKDK